MAEPSLTRILTATGGSGAAVSNDLSSDGAYVRAITEPQCLAPAMAERIHVVRGERTIREFATQLGMHPETVRRYCKDGKPSVEFIQKCCIHLKINGEWLLLARPPISSLEIRTHQLKLSSTTELLSELARRLANSFIWQRQELRDASTDGPISLAADE